MPSVRRLALLPATLAASLALACGPQRVPTPSRPTPTPDMVVLLADADTGAVGRAVVSNASGSTTLETARSATTIAPGQAPGAAATLSDAEITRLFGDVLSALPPAPRHFTLNFLFESDTLTPESRALVPEILKTVKDRASPDVVVIGHTDTMGAPQANVGLGLKRATTVRNLLVEAGVPALAIEVTSHGEADPLIKTPDETAEPRNRRVEIAVR
jgi:outer membrane protein OmpA-like peptidoglycan-associated protein